MNQTLLSVVLVWGGGRFCPHWHTGNAWSMVNRVKASSVQLNWALVQKKYGYFNIPSNLLPQHGNTIRFYQINYWSDHFSSCLYFYEIVILWLSNDCFWILNFQWWIESLLKWIYQIGFQIDVIQILVIGITLSYPILFRDIFSCQTPRRLADLTQFWADFVFI